MQIKICGITQPEQGQAIAQQGATALGFICARQSPRYVAPAQIKAVAVTLPESLERVGVFVNASIPEILSVVEVAALTAVQLHGEESPEFCEQLRKQIPSLKVMKAFRVRQPEVLNQVETYTCVVDSVLLDAYHPTQHGGTGRSIDWSTLQGFRPLVPWYLAGGLTPDNVVEAIAVARPDGVDLSSGVEYSPGQKDLEKVNQLFTRLRCEGLIS
ncbi:phosphoribosylanthranilate isomerase [Leptolyngbya sp. PL-A3]|nr:phosphoribosylanthranilate isomerase [Leptolyngbya sp. FACHB-8]MBD2157216.1 phosphoribosylanthranilate isomerase [Leptolyngbya sp. FACHB-16]